MVVQRPPVRPSVYGRPNCWRCTLNEFEALVAHRASLFLAYLGSCISTVPGLPSFQPPSAVPLLLPLVSPSRTNIASRSWCSSRSLVPPSLLSSPSFFWDTLLYAKCSPLCAVGAFGLARIPRGCCSPRPYTACVSLCGGVPHRRRRCPFPGMHPALICPHQQQFLRCALGRICRTGTSFQPS